MNTDSSLESMLERNLMTDPDVRFHQLIAAQKEHGFRLPPGRVECLRLIAVSEGHPRAVQLDREIKRRFPTVSHTTVDQTPSLFKEMNQVLEIDLREDSHPDGGPPAPHPIGYAFSGI